ncbi:MAG: potassium channel family protein [Alphaproteobacteria bacterium]|nr:potassium channel family protein [Alphaproteobacteria bacterium]
MSPWTQILFGMLLIALSVGFHAAFLILAMRPFRHFVLSLNPRSRETVEIVVMVIMVSSQGLAILAECVIWAVGFQLVGAISDFWEALYFVLVTITTLGFGDIILGEEHRLLAGLCALAGWLIIGMTTAVVIEILRRFVEDEVLP